MIEKANSRRCLYETFPESPKKFQVTEFTLLCMANIFLLAYGGTRILEEPKIDEKTTIGQLIEIRNDRYANFGILLAGVLSNCVVGFFAWFIWVTYRAYKVTKRRSREKRGDGMRTLLLNNIVTDNLNEEDLLRMPTRF